MLCSLTLPFVFTSCRKPDPYVIQLSVQPPFFPRYLIKYPQVLNCETQFESSRAPGIRANGSNRHSRERLVLPGLPDLPPDWAIALIKTGSCYVRKAENPARHYLAPDIALLIKSIRKKILVQVLFSFSQS
jgi:hypothetical protein